MHNQRVPSFKLADIKPYMQYCSCYQVFIKLQSNLPLASQVISMASTKSINKHSHPPTSEFVPHCNNTLLSYYSMSLVN